MKLLVLVAMFVINCSGRSLLDNHDQQLNSDIQEKSSSSSPILKQRSASGGVVLSSRGSPVRSATSTITTTLDPWDEFCKEACEEGLAGPECDCPDHPIGRRSVSNRRHRRSAFIDTSATDEIELLKHHFTSKAKPTVNLKVKRLLMKYCKIVCDYGIQNDICKCSGSPNKPSSFDKDPLYNINGSDVVQGNSTQVPTGAEGTTTTKDPLDEFCETACSNGQGTLACNCHDHIIGRRRRSLSSILAYPVKSSLKTLDSNSHQRYQMSLGQYQDITHLENALPRVTLNKNSVQLHDLSVNFPFRTLPENIKVHKGKFARVQLHKDSPHNQDLDVKFPYRKMTEKIQK